MQTIRLAFLALFAVLLLVPAAQAAPFVSAKGYSVTPPAGWSANKSGVMGTDVIIFTRAPGGFAPNLNVVITPAQPGQTLAQGQAQIAQVYPRLFTQFYMVKTGQEALGGQPALLVVGTYLQGAQRLSMRQDLVVKNGKVYTFTCTSPVSVQAKYGPAFAQLLHSVRWTH